MIFDHVLNGKIASAFVLALDPENFFKKTGDQPTHL